MRCDKCNGQGRVENKRYYNRSSYDAWIMGINERVNCKQCKGSGFIIGNVADVLSLLKHLGNMFETHSFNSLTETEQKEYLRQIKQSVETIEKY